MNPPRNSWERRINSRTKRRRSRVNSKRIIVDKSIFIFFIFYINKSTLKRKQIGVEIYVCFLLLVSTRLGESVFIHRGTFLQFTIYVCSPCFSQLTVHAVVFGCKDHITGGLICSLVFCIEQCDLRVLSLFSYADLHSCKLELRKRKKLSVCYQVV